MAAEDPGSGLASSLTDLMTSLAVIFILLLVALVNNKQQELHATQAEIDRIRKQLLEAAKTSKTTRETILVELRKQLSELSERGVEIKEDEKDPLGLLVVVPEGLLQFAVDRYDIPASGQEFLGEFVPTLASVACGFKDDLTSIMVEGHADSTGTDEHNLKLSQDRSMEVVRESLKILAGRERRAIPVPLEPCLLDLLSASGRGRRDPFLVNGAEDRPRSRRVIFKIRVRSFEQRQRELRDFGFTAASDPAHAN
jgi:outer membrane protein OmpA-like peptidoglycan-associated protein